MFSQKIENEYVKYTACMDVIADTVLSADEHAEWKKRFVEGDKELRQMGVPPIEIAVMADITRNDKVCTAIKTTTDLKKLESVFKLATEAKNCISFLWLFFAKFTIYRTLRFMPKKIKESVKERTKELQKREDLIYTLRDKKNKESVKERMEELQKRASLMKISSEIALELYKFHKTEMEKVTKEKEFKFSWKDAFWIEFGTMAACVGGIDVEYKIKLSEIFEIFLVLYCEYVDKEMPSSEKKPFLAKLGEKYYHVQEILQTGDVSRAGLHATRYLLDYESNILKLVFITMRIIQVASAISPLPYEIIEDI